MKNAVLIFPIKNNKILLGLKQKKVSVGLYSGYGGKQNKNEKIEQTAIREFVEETGMETVVDKKDLKPVGVIDFTLNQKNQEVFKMKVFIYILKELKGSLKNNDEMKEHTWFDIDKIPYEKMLPDNKIFLPKILGGEFFVGKISTYDNKILEADLKSISLEELNYIFSKY